jgi:hypothetical protein
MMRDAVAFCGVLLWALGAAGAEPPKDYCITCHLALERPQAEPAQQFEVDVHHQAGLGCSDCHGGDPRENSMEAMSPAKGFRGAPKKGEVPTFCARCHSDSTTMRRFNPQLRTDQLSQYWTSVHGKRLKQGDPNVATCIDCHGVHNILPASDTRSRVYPANVASTCARCHADRATMAAYKIPTDQAVRYSRSVHAELLAQGDLSAPTCSTCHGNHGAAPPGVDSVANICGTCHVFFKQLFETSPHQTPFKQMGLPGCVQCHSNHEVLRPSDDWLGGGPKSVCRSCHAEGDAGDEVAGQMAAAITELKSSSGQAEKMIDTAERSGMEVSSARLDLTSAHEALIKARVSVHRLDPREVRKLTGQGVLASTKALEAGLAALRERDHRRKGLGLSLIFIVFAVTGLYLKIRRIESASR